MALPVRISDVTLGQDTPSVPSLSLPQVMREQTQIQHKKSLFFLIFYRLEREELSSAFPVRRKLLFFAAPCARQDPDSPRWCQHLQEPFPGKSSSWLELDTEQEILGSRSLDLASRESCQERCCCSLAPTKSLFLGGVQGVSPQRRNEKVEGTKSTVNPTC